MERGSDVLATYAALFRRALAMMLASPLRPFLWLAGPAIVAAKVAPVAAVWLGGQALNELQQAADGHVFTPRLIGLGLALAALAGARIVFGALADIVRQRLDLDVEMHFEIIEARKLAALDIGAREDAAFQDLHQNVESAGARILTDLLKQPVEIMGNIAGLATAAMLVAQQSPLYLALIVLVSLPFLWTEYRAGAREYDARWISTPRRRAYFRALEAITDASSALELKVLGSIDRVVDETVALSKGVKQQQLVARKRGVLENLVVSLIVAVAVGALAFLVVRDAVAGALALGTAVFLMSSLWQVSGLFGALYREFAQASNTLRAARDFFRFLDWKPAVEWPADGWRIAMDEQIEIVFDNVSFRYPGRDDFAVREISCRFELGRRIGIVGKNGSGKSTFIKLLLRIYDPVAGRILYNGRDLREADLADLYRVVSLLPQDVRNYEFTTVAGNVELGAPAPLDADALARALAASEADEFVADLPKGADTPLGREFGGVRLSGGQAQRLAIARALYKRPRILVLDEPTSAIDALSEQLIFDRLMGADADARLTICISHRFTTLARADRILVFEEGRIAEQGAPNALKHAGGAYQALFDAQTKFLN